MLLKKGNAILASSSNEDDSTVVEVNVDQPHATSDTLERDKRQEKYHCEVGLR